MGIKDTWPPYAIYALKGQLDALADAVAERKRGRRTDDEQVWLTRFLVVRTCGYLEQVAYEVVREHIRQKSGGRIQALALSWVERSRTPSPENLIDLVARFGSDIAREFVEMLEDDDKRLKREIALLVDRRNGIAHGLNEGLTESKALALKADVEAVSEWLIKRLRP